jgi:threonylcarbamoyladenosine tRNA methylthiotransferase MtaB
MPQLERELVKARAYRLRESAAERRASWLKDMVGSVRPILVEGDGIGHTDNFAPITMTGAQRGQAGQARITTCDGNSLTVVWA